jgi:hypothetical protein
MTPRATTGAKAMGTKLWPGLFVAGLGLCAGYALHAGAEGAPGEAPLFYSGTLEAEGQLAEGPYAITLTLFGADKDGDALCTSEAAEVPVQQGRFRLEVSDECVAAFRGNADLWLALKFTGADGVPHELPGRSKVGAVPYALEAQHAVAASNGVPVGAVLMFQGACPPGFAELTTMRGRVPRGEPTGNAGALDRGGSDDAVVVSHTHTGSTGGGDHNHRGTTGGQSADHSHSGVTAENYAWPNCDVYDYDGRSGSSFNPSVFNSGYVGGNCTFRDRTTHAHGFATGGASTGHNHAVDLTGGGHSHSFTTGNASGGVAAAGMNMQAFQELLFCVRQ